jgi:hypothetical protein
LAVPDEGLAASSKTDLSKAGPASKHCRSRLHSTRHSHSARPPRWRSSVTLKAGSPGALASSARDGSAVTCQRVRAALGPGLATARSNMTVTPEPSAASARRRLAVRSSKRGSPQGSISTAPSAEQRAASAPARSTPCASRARTSRMRAGSRPSSARPGACKRPVSASRTSCRTQRIGRCCAARIARRRRQSQSLP